jgi:hypothetical protein
MQGMCFDEIDAKVSSEIGDAFIHDKNRNSEQKSFAMSPPKLVRE